MEIREFVHENNRVAHEQKTVWLAAREVSKQTTRRGSRVISTGG